MLIKVVGGWQLMPSMGWKWFKTKVIYDNIIGYIGIRDANTKQ